MVLGQYHFRSHDKLEFFFRRRVLRNLTLEPEWLLENYACRHKLFKRMRSISDAPQFR